MRTEIKENTDKQLVANIRKQLAANQGHCPCAVVKTKDTKCMCKEFRDASEGTCHCGLYTKTKN
ncbi:MAG: ferredoxin-thioredoxin reductase catalytic domain-containing protein [Clostridia bacterium]